MPLGKMNMADDPKPVTPKTLAEFITVRDRATEWASSDEAVKARRGQSQLEYMQSLPELAKLRIALSNLTKNELKVLTALDEKIGMTSAEISASLDWGGQSFHLHLGNFCRDRLAPLWPAPPSQIRSKENKVIPFFSGIIAEVANEGERWIWRGLKPKVRSLLVELGVLSG